MAKKKPTPPDVLRLLDYVATLYNAAKGNTLFEFAEANNGRITFKLDDGTVVVLTTDAKACVFPPQTTPEGGADWPPQRKQ